MAPDLLLPGDEPGPSPAGTHRWSPVVPGTGEEQHGPGVAGAGVPPAAPATLLLPLQSRISFLRTRGEGTYHFQCLSAWVLGRLKTRHLLLAAHGFLLCSRQPRGRAQRPAVEMGDGEGQDWAVTLRAVVTKGSQGARVRSQLILMRMGTEC